MDIRGRQSVDNCITAPREMSNGLAVTVVERFGSGTHSDVSLYMRVTLSLGLQVIGKLKSVTSDSVSAFPSNSSSSALSSVSSQFKNGVTSKSRAATVVGRPEYELSREYRILALAAGTMGIARPVSCWML